MGTDIHLEAERQLDDGTWDRIQHMSETCWSCGTYNRETGRYENATGMRNVVCERHEMWHTDVILKERENSEYVVLERLETCRYCKGTGKTYPQFFHNRNYDVFAIFGNVRNGSGFADVVTSSGFDPISDNRGLPENLSQEIIDRLALMGETVEDGQIIQTDGFDYDEQYEKLEEERDGWWSLGDHSFSWVTLDEILDYDWDRGIIKEGWVTPGQFQDFRETGRPSGWCGGVSGGNVEHISDTAMAQKIDSGDIVFEDDEEDPFNGRRYTTHFSRMMSEWQMPEGTVGEKIARVPSIYCHIKWLVPYGECVGPDFWQEIEYLKSLAPHNDPSKIRLVFGFDS